MFGYDSFDVVLEGPDELVVLQGGPIKDGDLELRCGEEIQQLLLLL